MQRDLLPAPNKLFGLELLRFICAVAVLFRHYQYFCYRDHVPYNFHRDEQPFYSIFHLFYDHGIYGVQAFWCISGFIFFWKYSENIAKGAITAQQFFVLRFSRLYPLHLLTLLWVAIFQWKYYLLNNDTFVFYNNDLYHFILQLFMASDWGLEVYHSFNAPIWSVSLEILVYVLFYFLLSTLGSSALITGSITTLCLPLIINTDLSSLYSAIFFFYAGGSMTIFRAQLDQHTKRFSIIEPFLILLLCLMPLLSWSYAWYDHPSFISVFFILYLPALVLVLSAPFNTPSSVQRFISLLGTLTYALYLTSFPLQLSIALLYSKLEATLPLYSYSFFFAYVGAAILLAYSSYRFFEAPVQRRIRNYYTKNIKAPSKTMARPIHISNEI